MEIPAMTKNGLSLKGTTINFKEFRENDYRFTSPKGVVLSIYKKNYRWNWRTVQDNLSNLYAPYGEPSGLELIGFWKQKECINDLEKALKILYNREFKVKLHDAQRRYPDESKGNHGVKEEDP